MNVKRKVRKHGPHTTRLHRKLFLMDAEPANQPRGDGRTLESAMNEAEAMLVGTHLRANDHAMEAEASPCEPGSGSSVGDTVVGADLFATLSIDAIQQITALLPTVSLFALTSVSRELQHTFCPSVGSLSISKMSLKQSGQTALSPVLGALSQRYPMLTHLDLSQSDSDNVVVEKIAHLFPHLTRLSLDGCDAVSDLALVELGRRLPQLLALSLLGCRDVTDRGVQALVHLGCTRLRELNLSWCFISDRGLIVLTQLGSSLTSLDISGCANVTDTGVRRLVRSCRRLSYLQLEGCRELSAWSVAEASPYLEHLYLGACKFVYDCGIGDVARSCIYLRTLCLRHCPCVKDVTLQHLKQCRHLERLDVSRCAKITDDGLSHVAEGCTQLRTLELEGYAEITDIVRASPYSTAMKRTHATRPSIKSLPHTDCDALLPACRAAARSVCFAATVAGAPTPANLADNCFRAASSCSAILSSHSHLLPTAAARY